MRRKRTRLTAGVYDANRSYLCGDHGGLSKYVADRNILKLIKG